MSDELVEVVDPDGRVLGIVTRREMRERTLRHRATYVVVVDGADQVIVHQRAPWKDIYPGYWDLAFGGVCGVGESWEEAAARELAEEAGIAGVALTDLGSVAYDQDDGKIVGRVFLARWDGEPTCPDGEVVAVGRVPAADLARWLVEQPVCPDSVELVVPLVAAALNPRRPGGS